METIKTPMAMKKEIRLTGNFLHFDRENLNGRIYTRETAEKIVEQFNKMKEESGVVFGELGYPTDRDFAGVNMLNRSHEIESINLDEKNKTIIGTIKLLDTPQGRIVRELIDPKNSIKLTCRPRGIGTINENKEVENFELLSFDILSGSDAFSNIKEDDYLTLFENE